MHQNPEINPSGWHVFASSLSRVLKCRRAAPGCRLGVAHPPSGASYSGIVARLARPTVYFLTIVLLFSGVIQAAPITTSTTQPAASKPALSRDEQLSLLKAHKAELDLEKAKASMEKAELELKDTEALYAENIVTSNELYKFRQAFKQAVIEYEQAKNTLEQTRLDFLKNATYIRVVDAKIFRNEENEGVTVSIQLRNDSDFNKARVVMGDNATDLVSLLKVNNIIVTLWGSAKQTQMLAGEMVQTMQTPKAIIGDPYQRVIPELKFGETVTLNYRLLREDVEDVSVQVEYLETTREYAVFLKKEALQDLPTITSAQYDQRGDLGTTIKYNLQLKRLSQTDQSFSLRVINFPEEIQFAFTDPESQAKITTVMFTSEKSTRTIDFEVSIPEKLDAKMIGANLPFYIMVAGTKELEKLHDLKKQYADKLIPPEEINKIKGNKVEMVLIPKGVGELEFIVGNLFKEIQQGQKVDLKFSVLNSGTLAVRRVAPEMDLPLEWEGEIEPREAEIIDPDQKVMFTAHLRPPMGVSIGEYTVKMEAKGHSGVETIEAKEKDFTIKVAPESHLTGTILLVGVLVALVLGIAVASVKIARR